MYETDRSFFDRVYDIKQKFGISSLFLVNPFKTIKWDEIEKLDKGDPVIMGAFSSKMAHGSERNLKPISDEAYERDGK
jgi:hypothetical protein